MQNSSRDNLKTDIKIFAVSKTQKVSANELDKKDDKSPIVNQLLATTLRLITQPWVQVPGANLLACPIVHTFPSATGPRLGSFWQLACPDWQANFKRRKCKREEEGHGRTPNGETHTIISHETCRIQTLIGHTWVSQTSFQKPKWTFSSPCRKHVKLQRTCRIKRAI